MFFPLDTVAVHLHQYDRDVLRGNMNNGGFSYNDGIKDTLDISFRVFKSVMDCNRGKLAEIQTLRLGILIKVMSKAWLKGFGSGSGCS